MRVEPREKIEFRDRRDEQIDGIQPVAIAINPCWVGAGQRGEIHGAARRKPRNTRNTRNECVNADWAPTALAMPSLTACSRDSDSAPRHPGRTFSLLFRASYFSWLTL